MGEAERERTVNEWGLAVLPSLLLLRGIFWVLRTRKKEDESFGADVTLGPIPSRKPPSSSAHKPHFAFFPYPLVTAKSATLASKLVELAQDASTTPVVVGDRNRVEELRDQFTEMRLVFKEILSEAEVIYNRKISDLRKAGVPNAQFTPIYDVGNIIESRSFCSGEGDEDIYIALLPTSRHWEAPVYMRFGGFNDCPPCAEQVAQLRYWHTVYGAKVACMCMDAVVLLAPEDLKIPDPLLLAKEIVEYDSEFQEDVDSHGLEGLASEIAEDKLWFFWWD